jgi:hypothetical protein
MHSRLLISAALAVFALGVGATPAAAIFPTATSLSVSPSQSCPGQTVTLTARVTTSNPAQPATGTVRFSDGGAVLATVSLGADGVATLQISTLSVNAHHLSATYSGDLLDNGSSSNNVTQRVTSSCAAAAGLGQGQGQAQAPPPLIAAAGDIACGPSNPLYNGGAGTSYACQQRATSNLLGTRSLSAVLPLGDLQYDASGSLQTYLSSYDPTWGRWRGLSHPIPGNHEYDDQAGAQGYWDYWNGAGARKGRAGVRGRGWYSFDLGSWHLVALNSNCDQISCRGHSRELKWLRRNLRHNRGKCVLAYMHHPQFYSGVFEDHLKIGRLWRALFHRGADVVLNGHDHIYERFAPQRPNGVLNRRRGISEFTVGTGGSALFPIASPRAPHSQFASATFGVLFMRLSPRSYDWSFVDTAGNPVDQGSRPCNPRWPRRHHGHHHPGHHHHGRAAP